MSEIPIHVLKVLEAAQQRDRRKVHACLSDWDEADVIALDRTLGFLIDELVAWQDFPASRELFTGRAA